MREPKRVACQLCNLEIPKPIYGVNYKFLRGHITCVDVGGCLDRWREAN